MTTTVRLPLSSIFSLSDDLKNDALLEGRERENASSNKQTTTDDEDDSSNLMYPRLLK
jgi:hypothetical protein